ncbi:MAG: family protein phosphatase [Acidobacteriota bacterium]|jgi:hypothetical protein|nr:family protein phosphatase [Acidobacteriota bacterium]
MACVLTVAVVEDGKATIGHVGDTRLYKIRRGQIEKVTHDHSPVGEREDSGELSEVDAMRHPRRNEVYRDVGTQFHEPDDPDFIDLIEIPFEPDSALLMCSDGLSDLATSAQILRIVEAHAGDSTEVVERLIEAANEAGGKDNITALFASGAEFAAAARLDGEPPVIPTAPLELPEKAADGSDADAVAKADAGEGPNPNESRNPNESSGPVERPRPGGFGRRALRWLGSRPLVFICGVLFCVLLLLLMPREWRSLWLRPEVIAPPPSPQARTLRVAAEGKEFTTIADALEHARPGDTVEVAPGEYHESVVMREGVAIVSAQPLGALIRLPEGSDEPRVAVKAEGVREGRLVGFRIEGDETSPLDVGVLLADSNVEVERMEISGAQAAGVKVTGHSQAVLIGNHIRQNAGSGVSVEGESEPEILHNWIIGNGAPVKGVRDVGSPGVEIHDSAQPVLIGNVIAENGAAGVDGLRAERQKDVEKKNYFGEDVKANRKGKVHARAETQAGPGAQATAADGQNIRR